MSAATPESRTCAQVQQAFCAHLRTPLHQPAPRDVPARTMALYRELFRNNFGGQLAGAFPVLRCISSTDYWDRLVEEFFAAHYCRSPLFHRLPHEFVVYLQQERATQDDDPPFLAELAHYEWVELALAQAEEELPPPRAAVPLQEIPQLSPLAWPLGYRYAVHRIGVNYRPQQPDATHLLVYRNRNDEVRFMELNPVSARLLQLIGADTAQNGEQLLRQIAAELQHPDPAVVVQGGAQLLHQLHSLDVLL